jgi:hypothetical protein
MSIPPRRHPSETWLTKPAPKGDFVTLLGKIVAFDATHLGHL